MRSMPVYPQYDISQAPSAKRWLAAGAILVLLSAGLTLLLHKNALIVITGMTFSLLLVVMFWLIRLLYYRFSHHNAHFFNAQVDQRQQQWWLRHCRTLAFRDIVLIGPSGSETDDWLRVLNNAHVLPVVRKERGGDALRVSMSMSESVNGREQQLAAMLVLQWQKTRKYDVAPDICYWLGGDEGWRAFVVQMAITFPALRLPDAPRPWMGEASLSTIIAEINTSPDDITIMVAGCQSLPAEKNSNQPAGESAVLWVLGPEGVVTMSRGEVYSPPDDKTPEPVFERVLLQSECEQPPEHCLLFSQPDIEGLERSGWNISKHVQDMNWGSVGSMEALIVISLAVIYAETQRTPCGWIAKDPQHSLSLGIVKPHGYEQK